MDFLPGCIAIVMVGAAAASVAGCSGAPQKFGGASSNAALSSSCGQTSVRGVDVYHGDNGGSQIDWSTVKAGGLSFAFVKATQGTTHVDSMFATNWQDMQAAGLVRGAYHFYTPTDDPTAQASFFASTVGAVSPGDLLVLDFEDAGGIAYSTLVAGAITFLRAVQNATGVTPILYTSPSFVSNFGGLGQFPLWVANWGVSCPHIPAAWSTYTFWQTGNTGSVSGISGAVDVDTFNGSLSDLLALGGGGGPTAGPPVGGGPGGGGGGAGGGSYGPPGGCDLGGQTYGQDACTETQQCDQGSWVDRATDPADCATAILPNGECVADDGTVAPENACTSSQQCDNGVWVDRSSDPSACL